MAVMKACTGASPSPLAIWGLPPERSFGGEATCWEADCLAARADFCADLFVGAFFVDLRAMLFTPVLPRPLPHRASRGGSETKGAACPGPGQSVRISGPRDEGEIAHSINHATEKCQAARATAESTRCHCREVGYAAHPVIITVGQRLGILRLDSFLVPVRMLGSATQVFELVEIETANDARIARLLEDD